jgi:hypothetical protein
MRHIFSESPALKQHRQVCHSSFLKAQKKNEKLKKFYFFGIFEKKIYEYNLRGAAKKM